MENITLLVVFGAGLLSFLSPCVLPMVPVYLTILTGPEIIEKGAAGNRLVIFLHSLSFVTGFALIFSALGAIAGLTAFAINPSSTVLNNISGSLMIAMGLFMLLALKVPRLNYARGFTPAMGATTGYLRSFFIGAIFTLAWTACVGPILGGVLAIALNSATAWRGAYLLAVYSLGLGLPFLVIGLAFDFARPLLRGLSRYSRVVHIVSALLLVTVGGLVLANKITWFATLAT